MTSLRIVRRAIAQWVDNQDARMGAALAYYTLFSIAPLLILTIHIVGLIFGEDAARGEVVEQLQQNLGHDAAGAIQMMIENAAKPGSGSWAAYVGLVAVIIGSLGIFLHLRTTLCHIWHLEPPKGSTWRMWILDYALAVLMVLCTSLLLLASLAASTALAVVLHVFEEVLPVGAWFWHLLEAAVSFLFLTLVFATIYRVLSGNRLSWGYVWYGAALCSLLFTVGNSLLGLYLAYASMASMYGAAGSLVVFLIWVYYSAQILFLCAELIQARRTRAEWLTQ
jgi:membrane protein